MLSPDQGRPGGAERCHREPLHEAEDEEDQIQDQQEDRLVREDEGGQWKVVQV